MVLGGVFGVLLILSAAAYRPILRAVIESQASSLGLSLRFDDFSVGFGTASISKVRFGLLGQSTLVGEAATIEFEPSLFGTSRITAKDGRITIVGPLRTSLEAVSTWRSKHGERSGIEVASRNILLEFRDDTASPSWLSLNGVNTYPSGQGGLFRATQTTLYGMNLGQLSVGWLSRKEGLSLWLGEGGEASSHSHMEVLSSSTPTLRFLLKGAPLGSLSQPLGLPGSIGASLNAQAELMFPPGQGLQGKMSGAFQGVSLAGTEWSGLTLGQTTFSSTIVGAADASKVSFPGLTVQSSGMGLQGNVDWARQQGGGILQGQLAGMVPCNMLIRNMAAGIAGPLGGIAGAVLGAAVGGQVSLSLGFHFDTRDPRSGVVTPVVGVGCNLGG